MGAREPLSVALRDIAELPADQYVGMIDPDAIACMRARFEAEGQHAPIWLRRNAEGAPTNWSVIAGRHRLRAAHALGWAYIDAEQRAVDGDDLATLQRLQVAENLDRRVLRPIERAIAIMVRWREVMTERHPDIAHLDARRRAAAIRHGSASASVADASATLADTASIDTVVGELCGTSARSIERYRSIYEGIVVPFPDLYADLNAHPLGEKLDTMAQLLRGSVTDIARRVTITAIIADPECPTVDAARVAAGIAADKGARAFAKQNRMVASFRNNWKGLDMDRKRAAVITLLSLSSPTILRFMRDEVEKAVADLETRA